MATAGRIANIPDDYDAGKFRVIMQDIGARFRRLEQLVGPYSVENYTVVRNLDMGTATAADIGNFLCTLVSDLQKAGRLS